MNWTAWHGSLNVCSWFLDQAKMLKLVLAVNVGFLAAVVVVTLAALHGGVRLLAVGVLCAALTIGMYAAPLGAMVSYSDRDRSPAITSCRNRVSSH
jgi:hypothetical protein